MTQQLSSHRRAAALLLAAAALPLTPLAAQEAQTQTQTPSPFAVQVPPPITTQPVELPAPEPVVTPEPAAPTAEPAPAARAPAARRAPARTAARAEPRPAARAPARVAPAPAPAASAPAAAPAQAPAPAAEAPPPPIAQPTAPAAAPPAAAEQGTGPSLLWIALGALALGALALFFLLRRRRGAAVDRVDEPADDYVEPVAAVAAVEEGRPEIDLDLRPVRAGVTGDDAVVEFELDVANHGSAPARDVRVSTWMVPAGSATEMERSLIERPDEAGLSIAAGGGECLARSVTLPTSSVDSDAVLPVVVAEARYTLPDGSEGRTSASYAVGVPDGEELAHFAIDNPSGLHDEVVAKPLGETERA